MMKVNLWDNNFSHTQDMLGFLTSSDTRKPSKIEYEYRKNDYDGITLFTDFCINADIIRNVKSKYKVIWLLEPECIHPWAYEAAKVLQSEVDCIFTHNTDYAKKFFKKWLLSRVASSRVDNFLDLPKNKLISIIASDKKITEGHRLRHEIIEKYASKYGIDLFGTAYKKFDSKLEPLADYCYSICIQNCSVTQYYTEIVVDAFRTKTIPIFWGCPTLHFDFNRQGYHQFTTLNFLEQILDRLSFDSYNERKIAVEDNFKRSAGYVSTDDLLVETLEQFMRKI